MQFITIRGSRPRSLWPVAAGIFLTFGLGIQTATTAGERGAWPESPATSPGPVMQGVLQVRHILQAPAPPPAPPAEPELAPVPTRQVPALLELPMDQPQSDTEESTRDYELLPLRDAIIRVAAPLTYVDSREIESNLTTPPDHGAAQFTGQVDLRDAANGWFETVPYGHVACVEYHPLYFEELSLERYGEGFGCWQSLVSAGHFYGALPLLPYKLVASPPCGYESSCQYPPAATPAGRISCWRPIDLKGAAFEAGVIAAAILLVP